MRIADLEKATKAALSLRTDSDEDDSHSALPVLADDAFDVGVSQAHGGDVHWEKHHVYTTVLIHRQHSQQQAGGYVRLKFSHADLRLQAPQPDTRTIIESCSVENVFVNHVDLGITGACRVLCLDDDTVMTESIEHDTLDAWLTGVTSSDERDDSVTLWCDWVTTSHRWIEALKASSNNEAFIACEGNPSNVALLMFMGFVTLVGSEDASCSIDSRADLSQATSYLIEILIKGKSIHLRSRDPDALAEAIEVSSDAVSDPMPLVAGSLVLPDFEMITLSTSTQILHTRQLESGDDTTISTEFSNSDLPKFVTYHDTPAIRAQRRYKTGMVGWHEASVQASLPTTFQAAGIDSLSFYVTAHLRVTVVQWADHPVEEASE